MVFVSNHIPIMPTVTERTTLLPTTNTASVQQPSHKFLSKIALATGVLLALAVPCTLPHFIQGHAGGRHAGGMGLFFALASIATALPKLMDRTDSRLPAYLHAAVWTAGAVVAGHAVTVAHRPAKGLSWHGRVGYLLLVLLALQYLLGGRSISLLPRRRDSESPEHAMLRLHRRTGYGLYGALGAVLVAQCGVVGHVTTATLGTLATLLILYGVVVW